MFKKISIQLNIFQVIDSVFVTKILIYIHGCKSCLTVFGRIKFKKKKKREQYISLIQSAIIYQRGAREMEADLFLQIFISLNMITVFYFR
jgi:hypothetical protein